MKKLLISLPVIFLLGGCVTPISQSNLYWGAYSHTLYNLKKNPSEKSKKAHENELLKIVSKSKDLNLKVPPGVYAELGVFSQEKGDDIAANNYFSLEQKEYSESDVLMSRITKIKSSAK